VNWRARRRHHPAVSSHRYPVRVSAVAHIDLAPPPQPRWRRRAIVVAALIAGYAFAAPYAWLEWPWPQRLPHATLFGGYEYARPDAACHSVEWWMDALRSEGIAYPNSPFRRIGTMHSALGVGGSPLYDVAPLVAPHQTVFARAASGCYAVYDGTDVPGG
jgi:hypothetical protein